MSSYSRGSVAMDGDIIFARRNSSSNDLTSVVPSNTLTTFAVNGQTSPQADRHPSSGVAYKCVSVVTVDEND